MAYKNFKCQDQHITKLTNSSTSTIKEQIVAEPNCVERNFKTDVTNDVQYKQHLSLIGPVCTVLWPAICVSAKHISLLLHKTKLRPPACSCHIHSMCLDLLGPSKFTQCFTATLQSCTVFVKKSRTTLFLMLYYILKHFLKNTC